ncbi:MAG TPA: ATP-binding protein [Gemmatimonadaceae bacterium]|nr:ATP-binding protein [Gemmatimonadaceae bacterium]
MHFISGLPFPVLGIDEKGTICESNGTLEREVGQDHSLHGRSLAESLVQGSEQTIDLILGARAGENRVVQLAFAGVNSKPRTFCVIVEGDTRWLMGQPREFDEQRDAVAAAHERAEAQTDEYARISQELLTANDLLAHRARALIEASETKARFLASMSHELRTPLNAVLGYAGLLRDGVYGTINEPQERAVQAIVRRSKDLQLLIDDVLDLAKIESGRAEPRVDEFDPSAVLAEVKEAIDAFARDKNLRVSVRTKIRRRVRLDRAKYKQVVLNLASNAVKFTPEGGEVELSAEEGDGETMLTYVRDTGIGIAPENLDLIFDDFQQLETGNTRRFQGIGLGLSIVKRTVELLAGDVTVKSEPGRGTAFCLRFPMRPHGEALVGESGAIPDESALSNDPILLAIDDDPEVIALLRDSLAPAHFRVVGALNGDRGIELARILKPLAITLDIMMPEKDGWQVLREVKADPELCRIPVIIMSIVSERSLGFSLGVTDYLVKPVDRRVLIDVLERLRQRKVMQSALVVDEDYDARTLLSDLLRSMGLRVRTCDTAASCIDSLQKEPADLLFLDVEMPEREVSRIVDFVNGDRRFENTRTVVITRNDVDGEKQQWMRDAAAEVVYEGHEHAEALLNDLRGALTSLGAAV